MNKVFYGLAVVIAVVLIVLGVLASRQSTAQTDSIKNGDSFNADQLQDAAKKQPAPN